MGLDWDIYNSEEHLERGCSTLTEENGYRKQDIKDILEYINNMAAMGVKPIRLKKQVYVLRKLSKETNKAFRKCTKKDLIELIAKIESSKEYKDWTKYDKKVVLKRFYRWINGDEEYPDCIKWLKLKEPKNSMLPEELLTEEDVIKAIDSAKYMRDKAFICALYESGCRISELLKLQIKNVAFGEHVTSLIVSGKTGQRRVPLITSTTYLSTWISMHPFREDPDAALWTRLVNAKHKKGINVMSYKGMQKVLQVTFERAGIKKRFNPHLFRHSRATHLAKHLTEAQLKELFGWTQASDMASRYVHLSGRDVDSAILKLHGIQENECKEEVKLTQIACARCKAQNPSNYSLCKQCGGALNEKIAINASENSNEIALHVMQSIIKDLNKLQGQGMDLQKFNEFMTDWVKNGGEK